jgi:hypothetical protein
MRISQTFPELASNRDPPHLPISKDYKREPLPPKTIIKQETNGTCLYNFIHMKRWDWQIRRDKK